METQLAKLLAEAHAKHAVQIHALATKNARLFDHAKVALQRNAQTQAANVQLRRDKDRLEKELDEARQLLRRLALTSAHQESASPSSSSPRASPTAALREPPSQNPSAVVHVSPPTPLFKVEGKPTRTFQRRAAIPSKKMPSARTRAVHFELPETRPASPVPHRATALQSINQNTEPGEARQIRLKRLSKAKVEEGGPRFGASSQGPSTITDGRRPSRRSQK